MSVLDRRATITSEHQARLDSLADALTETVMLRLLGDPAFIERIIEALHFRERADALRTREALIKLVRAFETAHGLQTSLPARNSSVDDKYRDRA